MFQRTGVRDENLKFMIYIWAGQRIITRKTLKTGMAVFTTRRPCRKGYESSENENSIVIVEGVRSKSRQFSTPTIIVIIEHLSL